MTRAAHRFAPDHAAPAWEVLMAAAQAGDARAYNALLRAILPLLRSIARRRLPNPAEVEDAVQDTLLTIHELRHAYNASRPLRPWITALCERRCVDRARRGVRRSRHEAPAEMLAEEIGDLGATDAAYGPIAAAELRAAVARLSPSQQLAIRMLKLQDRSLAEASAMTGRSIATLKIATHRAVHALRLRLNAAAA